jgi:cation diffusion facilitator family transporter
MENHNSVKAILYAFLANLGIGITKLIAAIYTGSGSMLAEAIHSFADTSNQILLFIGLKRSKRPPDEKHPLGYGKTIYFWSFLVAILLFSMGGLFSVYEGIHKIDSKDSLQSEWIALTVLGISIVLETLSLIGAIKEINTIKKDIPLLKWLKESSKVELVVVFWEDIAALLGLIIAFIFVLLAHYLDNPVYDAIGSILIGILLILISILISIRIKSMIIGESANLTNKKEILKIIEKYPQIEDVLNVITVQLGPDVMIAAKIKLNSNLNLTEAVENINQLEKDIKKNLPDVKWSFIEPDFKD